MYIADSKLKTKEQYYREQLGLIIPYTDEEIRILKGRVNIEIWDEIKTSYELANAKGIFKSDGNKFYLVRSQV